jgi:DNA helicase II / ATP-dependent DNA helicase PcrA
MKAETAPSGFPLNPEQRRAVEHGEGPLLVVAGAGTGKTRVITERIRNLLESDPGLAGENILGLTFTDKAANEMKHRVKKAAGERGEGVWLSTFHKFCMEKVLREAIPESQILDPIDHWILLRRNLAELKLVKFRRLAEPGEFLTDFVQFFSRCQDELVTPRDFERYVKGVRRDFESRKKSMEADARAIEQETVEQREELARVYETSERLLRERGLLTFGALLLRAVEVLREDAGLRERLQEQYRYILVDEFQDTNIAQLELLRLLAGEQRNILAVGDDDQAIYRFRGASFGSFTIFLKQFCGVTEAKLNDGVRRFLVPLSQNYRSTQKILRVAGEVIQHNDRSPLLPPKNLTTRNADGEKVRVAEFGTPEEEGEWVASEIERLHAAGAGWKNFSVLYRKHMHRAKLLDVLRRRNIPFVIKNFSILSSTVVRDLLAYLRMIATPTDNVSAARVLAAPYWKLEPRDLVRLAQRAKANRRRPIWDELTAPQRELPFGGSPASGTAARIGDTGAHASGGQTKIPELVEMLNGLRQAARKKSASEVLDQLIFALELAPLASDADRLYLGRFVRFVRDWEKKSEERSLRDFVEYLHFFGEADGDICLTEDPADDAVQLMTAHAAKGLEFQHVFILQLNNGDFPARPRRPVFEFPPELMKEEKPAGDFQVQEERRLFYVALTRAKQHLTLTTTITKRKKASPFLDDFLMNGKIQRFDTQQLSPKVEVRAAEESAGPMANPGETLPLFGPAMSRALATTALHFTGETRAYSQIAVWARAYKPAQPEPLQLSASAIDAYDRCPMKYLFQHAWGIRGGARSAMTFGNVMHTTIKDFVGQMRKGRTVGFDEVEAVYQREWSSAGYPDDYLEGEYRRAGREQLEAFHRSYTAAPPDVMHQEKPFELPLEHNVVVMGRMDQINRLGPDADSKEVEIVDYKTGRHQDARKAHESLQLGIYALAAREVLDLEPARLVFYNLSTNEGVATTRDAKALKRTKETIAMVADQIRAGAFDARPGFGCRDCDYKALCPAHEQLISIVPASQAGT